MRSTVNEINRSNKPSKSNKGHIIIEMPTDDDESNAIEQTNENQTFMMKHKVKALWALLALTACFALISTLDLLQSAASNRKLQMHPVARSGEGDIKFEKIKLPSLTKSWKEWKDQQRQKNS